MHGATIKIIKMCSWKIINAHNILIGKLKEEMRVDESNLDCDPLISKAAYN